MKIFHTRKQKASDPPIRELRPVFPSYVFVDLNGTEPNWAQFFAQSSISQFMSDHEREGRERFAVLPDRDLADLTRRALSNDFCDKFTKAVLFFEQYIGRKYKITKGMFSGCEVTITEIKGAYVYFDLQGTIQNAPVSLIADWATTEEEKFFVLSNGKRLTIGE